MDSIWSLNVFLIFTGLTCEIAAAWLLIHAERVESPALIVRFALIMLFVAIPLQIIGLLVPQVRIASYWFVLGALPLLLPAPLLYQAKQRPSGPSLVVSPRQIAMRAPSQVAVGEAQTEFQELLGKIPNVLSQHPGGLTLVQIGHELGVEWRRLTGAINELLQHHRIRKEGKRYFAPSRKYR
jgi:hypothetical protein